jgi:CheY-like chemotaxis protein
MKLNDKQFTAALRSSLHYLYELDQLHRNPLIGFFGLAGRMDAALTLQQIIMDAIQALKPGDGDPPQSSAWRFYDLLFFRYVRGDERLKVANQLGISDRQLAREQNKAIQALALYLWKTYKLDHSQITRHTSPDELTDANTGEQQTNTWVDALPSEKPAPWKSTLLSVMDLIHSLIRENNVNIRYEPREDLPDLLVPQVAIRHSMLTVLGWMVPQARHGDMIVKPSLLGQTLIISVQIPGRVLASESLDPGIGVARQLIERAGGSLDLVSETSLAEIRLAIPTLPQIPVLVIDDNPDTIQLFQRYVQGSRYFIVGLQEPAGAHQLIDEINPRILLLDVMMPELDGWDLLIQLRMSGKLRNTSILICSILPQEVLARSLGANGFLQKPVLPQDFLNMLDLQMEHLSQEPDNQ